jgi:hypothetical protein
VTVRWSPDKAGTQARSTTPVIIVFLEEGDHETTGAVRDQRRI